MKLDGNLHTTNARVTLAENETYVAIQLHERGQAAFQGNLTIFIDEPEAFAAWRTLAETLAALDMAEKEAV